MRTAQFQKSRRMSCIFRKLYCHHKYFIINSVHTLHLASPVSARLSPCWSAPAFFEGACSSVLQGPFWLGFWLLRSCCSRKPWGSLCFIFLFVSIPFSLSLGNGSSSCKLWVQGCSMGFGLMGSFSHLYTFVVWNCGTLCQSAITDHCELVDQS